LASALATGGLAGSPAQTKDPQQAVPTALDSPALLGEFGACLEDLRRFYSGPENPNESNHYIELWEGRTIRATTQWAGMTNNHTLFINSHGKALQGSSRHAYYPHSSLLSNSQSTPYYSAKDFATLLRDASTNIHNIILAGCDFDRSFKTSELRQHFVNATNITHSAAGKAGYQPMYLQAILSRSEDIKPLYETPRTNAKGVKEYHIRTTPSLHSTQLTPYIAELFRPGEKVPYKIQKAGCELIQAASPPPLVAASP